MKEIPIEKIGRVTKGPETGRFVLVRDDCERTGGFLIFESSAPDMFSASEVFDSWVAHRLDLHRFFCEADWDVERQ